MWSARDIFCDWRVATKGVYRVMGKVTAVTRVFAARLRKVYCRFV